MYDGQNAHKKPTASSITQRHTFPNDTAGFLAYDLRLCRKRTPSQNVSFQWQLSPSSSITVMAVASDFHRSFPIILQSIFTGTVSRFIRFFCHTSRHSAKVPDAAPNKAGAFSEAVDITLVPAGRIRCRFAAGGASSREDSSYVSKPTVWTHFTICPDSSAGIPPYGNGPKSLGFFPGLSILYHERNA